MRTKTRTALLAAMLVVCAANLAQAQAADLGPFSRAVDAAAAAWAKSLLQPTAQLTVDAFRRTRALILQAQALIDTQDLRDSLADVDALILWHRGRVSDEQKDYATAVRLMAEAHTKRPALFKDARDQAYLNAVVERHRHSMPNSTETVNMDDAGFVLKQAVSESLWDASLQVQANVVEGFKAAMAGNRTQAGQWFQRAANLAPSDAGVQRFSALAGSAALRASRGLDVPSGNGLYGPLPQLFDIASLKEHIRGMSGKQVMKALEDILLVLYRN